MNALTKLRILQEKSGFTQQQIAIKLGVSFQSVNAWMTQKSVPRKKMLVSIDKLYFETIGFQEISNETYIETNEKVILLKDINWKNNLKKSEIVKDLLVLKMTYHTNSIEGSTLTEGDTDAILFKKEVLKNKSIIEHLEVINHEKAIYKILEWSDLSDFTAENLLELHQILMQGILDNAGKFRQHAVRILGSFVPTANPLSIEKKIVEWLFNINKKDVDIEQIAKSHAIFEQIHPFSDGNGRVGRLIVLWQLLRNGYPPILITKENKFAYYKYLKESQLNDNQQLLTYFFNQCILNFVDIIENNT